MQAAPTTTLDTVAAPPPASPQPYPDVEAGASGGRREMRQAGGGCDAARDSGASTPRHRCEGGTAVRRRGVTPLCLFAARRLAPASVLPAITACKLAPWPHRSPPGNQQQRRHRTKPLPAERSSRTMTAQRLLEPRERISDLVSSFSSPLPLPLPLPLLPFSTFFF